MDFNQTKSAFELAQKIREQKITSFALTDFYIKKILSVNTSLNALVEDNFVQALKQAQACDEEIKNNPQKMFPPLFGVPMTIKEMIAVEGFKQTIGSIHRRENRSKQDATVVARLKKAGIIILGTTNVPEMGLWFECNNPVYGDTLNPYNSKYTSGGSSGGEAALLGAGATPLGLGSDIGGSLRMPAGFCGIFAHKPSEKWIPLTGQFPYTHDEIVLRKGENYPFTVIGPMTRTAVDLKPYFKILIGPDDYDQETESHQLNEDPVNWNGRKVFVISKPKIKLCFPTHKTVQRGIEQAAETFKKLGAEIIELPNDLLADAFQIWSARSISVETKKFVELLAPDKKFSLFGELKNWSFAMMKKQRPDYQMSSLVTVLAESVAGSQEKTIEQKLKDLENLKLKMNQYLGKENILLMPVHPRTAPPHNKTLMRPFDFTHTAIFNALGLAATSAPVGFSNNGLPLAVQIIAGQDQDHLCMEGAIEIEKDLGGWKPPK